MANGANGVHLQLREALEDYIKSQYFGKSPILLSAVQNKLDQEGILYQKPYIESSPAYKSELNGIQKSSKLPDWVKAYFDALANADLGVHSSPFCHQVEALEAAFAGKDLFVSTGTGSGKTECFMWPLLAKLAAEARNTPANWSMRGVRTIIMYPMNALVSDQVSRLRRLIGDSEHRFVNAFRETCGEDSRRPQFGMYTGRTPYAGKEPKRSADRSLVATYSEMLNAETNEEKAFLQKLIKDGKFPVKEDFHEFLRKLYDSKHIPDDEDAELVTSSRKTSASSRWRRALTPPRGWTIWCCPSPMLSTRSMRGRHPPKQEPRTKPGQEAECLWAAARRSVIRKTPMTVTT